MLESAARRSQGPSVAIIGGGFAGIGAAVKLAKAGLREFTIFEKSEGIGGTWWENRYPGAEVDVHSQLYSYAFHPHDWSRTHARQAELQRYLEDVVDGYGLRTHFRLSTSVEEVAWDDDAKGYVLRTADGETKTFRAVISAVGMLNIPNYPPGRASMASPGRSCTPRDGDRLSWPARRSRSWGPDPARCKWCRRSPASPTT